MIKNKEHNISLIISSYIIMIFLIPLLGVGEKGSSLNTILKSIILLLFILAVLFMASFRINKSPLALSIVVLFILSQLCCLIAYGSLSYLNTIAQFVVIFITLMIIPIIKTNKLQIAKGIILFLIFNFIAIVYNFIKNFNYFITFSFVTSINYTIYSFFDNKNTYGMVLFVSLVMLFYLKNLIAFKKKRIFVSLVIIQILSIIISMCRTALLCSAIFILLVYLTGNYKNRNKIIITFILLLSALIILVSPSIREYLLYHVIRIDVGTYRELIYEGSRDLILQSPIFGYGIENWRESLLVVGGNVYSHNGYYGVLLDGGAMYLLAYLLTMIFTIKNAIAVKKLNKNFGNMTLIFIFSFLIYSIFENTVLCGTSAANYALTFVGVIIPSLLLNSNTHEEADNLKKEVPINEEVLRENS